MTQTAIKPDMVTRGIAESFCIGRINVPVFINGEPVTPLYSTVFVNNKGESKWSNYSPDGFRTSGKNIVAKVDDKDAIWNAITDIFPSSNKTAPTSLDEAFEKYKVLLCAQYELKQS